MVGAHVAFGANLWVLSDSGAGQMVAVTGGAVVLNLVATIAAESSHFTALLQKSRTLHLGNRQCAPLLVTEATFVRITVFQVAGTSPAGMQAETMPAGSMLGELLFVAGPAKRRVNSLEPGNNPFMVFAVTILTADAGGIMRRQLPLLHRPGRFDAVAGDTIVFFGGQHDAAEQG